MGEGQAECLGGAHQPLSVAGDGGVWGSLRAFWEPLMEVKGAFLEERPLLLHDGAKRLTS